VELVELVKSKRGIMSSNPISGMFFILLTFVVQISQPVLVVSKKSLFKAVLSVKFSPKLRSILQNLTTTLLSLSSLAVL
jgi:hypothetical protein